MFSSEREMQDLFVKETKRIYIEYYTKDLMEINYLWSCIADLVNELSEALKYN